MSDCKQLTPPTPKEIQDNLPNILAMMGIQSCKQISGGAASIECLCAAAFTGNVGCEQISVISEQYLKTSNIVSCILNSVKNGVTNEVTSQNTFTLEVGKGALVELEGNIDVTQTSIIDFYNVNQINNEVKNNIVTELQNMIQETLKSIQDSKTEWLSTPEAQKQITKLTNDIKNNVDTKITNKVVSDILTTVKSGNNITIKVDGVLRAKDMTFNQKSVLSITVQNLVSTALKNFVQNTDITKLLTDMQNSQKSVAKGPDLAIAGIMALLVLLAVGGFVIFGGGTVIKLMNYIIPIFIVVALVVGIIFGIKKEYVITGICAGAVVLLGGFEFFSIKKAHSEGEIAH